MLSHDALVEYLIREWDYTAHEADTAATALLASQPQIQHAFEEWRTTGVLPRIEAEGYTPQQFVEQQGLSPVAALLTLDWLLAEPEAAKKAIAEGYDTAPHPAPSAGTVDEGIALSDAELLFLVRLFRPQVMPVSPGVTATEQEMARASQSLHGRGLIATGAGGETQVAPGLAGIISACAWPDVSLVATRTKTRGAEASRSVYLTREIMVEDETVGRGRHRLLRVTPDVLAGRLIAVFDLAGQPAAPGQSCRVARSLQRAASEAARRSGVRAAERVLQGAELSASAAAPLAEALARPVSGSALAISRQGRGKEGHSLGMLETAQGMWRLQAMSESEIEIAPASAAELIEEVERLVAEALAMLP